ncbi:RING-type E3 ubiquitin transferase [Malassezia vespertilionis]|uniref:E3 ubiquitin protein ligase n=1 Tax=Malassezia vespertilionis TaxID=2020962 RepID=A0A2N1JB06_9BASI|nr:RING-type E3 ubiquitin transferase [Malassezia vespertilionis]PKI83740.1 Bre1p [Malassezia vespertilionis]WFD07280.1 RING-type E3 ubiquitin transferase [Malassezia vespertilionis]
MDRKRAHAYSEGGAPSGPFDTKRMHVDDGFDDDENPDYARLERFRKEAIYRCMREAKRDAKRANAVVQMLELRMHDMRGCILAVNQFWDALLESVHLLDEQIIGAELCGALAAFAPLSLEMHNTEQLAALAQRAEIANKVLAALVSYAARTRPHESVPKAMQDLQARCQTLANEASAARQQVQATHAQLSATESGKARVTEDLRAAQRQLDRSQSGLVQSIEDPQGKALRDASTSQKSEPTQETEEQQSTPNGTDKDAAIETQQAAIAAAQEELESVRNLAQARLEEAHAVRAELLDARQQIAALASQLQSLPDERIRTHPAYHELLAEMVFLQQEAERLRTECAATQKENEDMREFRAEFQHQTATQANTHADELQKQVRTRDTDIVRLRGQRDELNAEMLERRARDTVKFTQVDDLKALLAAKDERMEALKSQAHRLQLQVAALRGDTLAVERLNADGVDVLAKSMTELASENAALRAQLASDDTGAETHKALAACKALLAKATTPEDALERWSALQHEATQGRQEADAANASAAAMYDEVDRLTAAYDVLEKETNTKLANLARLEEKIMRLTTEKSKADNKYFAAMRAKDAVDAEKRTLARNAERQSKVIERYTETEKALGAQLGQAEKEISALRRGVQTHTTALAEMERDKASMRRRLAEIERAKAAADAAAAQHLATTNAAADAQARAEERGALLDKELSRTKRLSSGTVKKKGDSENTHLEYLNSLLRCSSCKERYRNRIITRCLHTFCDECVNARIQTRQRKCPHCASAFATSDVQVLYLQ